MKNRTELAKYLGEQGYKLGAEIGTCYGEYAKRLYENIPDLQLIVVDNWDNAETERRQRVHARNVEWYCRNALANHRAIVIKMASLDAAKLIADGSLDFVYIDAAHDYDNVKADLEAWTPKVRQGGIVAGHDYYVFPGSGNDGVVRAVDEFVGSNGYKLETTDWDKENPARDERQPSWWFVK